MNKAIQEKTGKEVEGRAVTKQDGPFRCPAEDCKAPEVIVRKSHEWTLTERGPKQVKVDHFAHKAFTGCTWCEGESEDHRLAKYQIADLLTEMGCTEVHMEYSFGGVRPDVSGVLPNGKKIAVEIQSSQIAVEQVKRRNEIYNRYGYYVLWLTVFEEERMADLYRVSVRSQDMYLYELYGRHFFYDTALKMILTYRSKKIIGANGHYLSMFRAFTQTETLSFNQLEATYEYSQIAPREIISRIMIDPKALSEIRQTESRRLAELAQKEQQALKVIAEGKLKKRQERKQKEAIKRWRRRSAKSQLKYLLRAADIGLLLILPAARQGELLQLTGDARRNEWLTALITHGHERQMKAMLLKLPIRKHGQWLLEISSIHRDRLLDRETLIRLNHAVRLKLLREASTETRKGLLQSLHSTTRTIWLSTLSPAERTNWITESGKAEQYLNEAGEQRTEWLATAPPAIRRAWFQASPVSRETWIIEGLPTQRHIYQKEIEEIRREEEVQRRQERQQQLLKPGREIAAMFFSGNRWGRNPKGNLFFNSSYNNHPALSLGGIEFSVLIFQDKNVPGNWKGQIKFNEATIWLSATYQSIEQAQRAAWTALACQLEKTGHFLFDAIHPTRTSSVPASRALSA